MARSPDISKGATAGGEIDETTTLLPSSETTESLPQTQGCPPNTTPTLYRSSSSWPWTHVVVLCMALAIISDIGEDLFAAPKVRLFESVVCTHYYSDKNPSYLSPDGTVQEKLCKIDPVQDEVAFILGWQLFFDSIPAILLPIPYGYIADKHGRKWILCLALAGYTLSWASTLFLVGVLHAPLPFVWLSSLFFIIGGGPTTETTMITTIVADVVPPELRTVVFFYRFCTDLVADFVTPPLTSILMDRNTWIPLVAAVGFQALSVVMALFLPETMPTSISEHASENLDRVSIVSNSSQRSGEPGKGKTLFHRIRKTGDLFCFVINNSAVAALVPTFLISKVGRQATNILFQYASIKYHWSLSQAGLLLSLRAAVNICLFALILPAVAKFALTRTDSVQRDLWIGKVSIILMVVGSFMIFSSSVAAFMIIGVVVYTLGTGFPPIIRSLVTFLVESNNTRNNSDIGRLYALISVMEGIGSLVAGPGMAYALRVGISLGPAWLGLPFALAGSLFALVSLVLFTVKIPA